MTCPMNLLEADVCCGAAFSKKGGAKAKPLHGIVPAGDKSLVPLLLALTSYFYIFNAPQDPLIAPQDPLIVPPPQSHRASLVDLRPGPGNALQA